MEKIFELSKRDVSFLASGFFAGCIATLFFVFACAIFYSTPLPSAPPAETSAPTRRPTRVPTEVQNVSPLPTRVPTRTPTTERCYLKLVATEGQYTATVYLSVYGRNALLFCDYMAEDDDYFSVSVVGGVPGFQVWCKQDLGNGVVVEVISEYQMFGEAACEGISSGLNGG